MTPRSTPTIKCSSSILALMIKGRILTIGYTSLIGALGFTVSAFTTIFTIYALNKDGNKYMENNYGKLWWTAPVVGHIGLNSIIIKENAEFYKSLKTNNKIFKDYRFV